MRLIIRRGRQLHPHRHGHGAAQPSPPAVMAHRYGSDARREPRGRFSQPGSACCLRHDNKDLANVAPKPCVCACAACLPVWPARLEVTVCAWCGPGPGQRRPPSAADGSPSCRPSPDGRRRPRQGAGKRRPRDLFGHDGRPAGLVSDRPSLTDRGHDSAVSVCGCRIDDSQRLVRAARASTWLRSRSTACAGSLAA